jgi:hypothetical protein
LLHQFISQLFANTKKIIPPPIGYFNFSFIKHPKSSFWGKATLQHNKKVKPK